MEALHLVDHLERLLTEGLHIPLTTNIIVNEQEFLDVIDRLRTTLQQEARPPASARQEPEPAVVGPIAPPLPPELSGHELVQAAQAHADRIIAEAQNQAETFKADADGYVLEELQQLQAHLEALLRRVRNGIRTVQKEGALASRKTKES